MSHNAFRCGTSPTTGSAMRLATAPVSSNSAATVLLGTVSMVNPVAHAARALHHFGRRPGIASSTASVMTSGVSGSAGVTRSINKSLEVGPRESRAGDWSPENLRPDPGSGRRQRSTEPQIGSRRRSRPASFVPNPWEIGCKSSSDGVRHSGLPFEPCQSTTAHPVGRSRPACTIGRICDGLFLPLFTGNAIASRRARPPGRPRRLVLAAPGTSALFLALVPHGLFLWPAAASISKRGVGRGRPASSVSSMRRHSYSTAR